MVVSTAGAAIQVLAWHCWVQGCQARSCWHSDGQFYVFKGKFSFSLKKSSVIVSLFAVEMFLLKYKGRLLHCLVPVLSHCSYN